MDVEYVQHAGDDNSVLSAMLVSTKADAAAQHAEDEDKRFGRLRFLMRNKHASPFEHGWLTVMVHAPIFVAREWHRHRTQSYNEVSGRYKKMDMEFYYPDTDNRPLVQTGKPGNYEFESGSTWQGCATWRQMEKAYAQAKHSYNEMLRQGIAKEVARMVLPLGMYTTWYASANLRNWLNFLALRTDTAAMWEIRQLAFDVEEIVTDCWPDVQYVWAEQDRPSI